MSSVIAFGRPSPNSNLRCAPCGKDECLHAKLSSGGIPESTYFFKEPLIRIEICFGSSF